MALKKITTFIKERWLTGDSNLFRRILVIFIIVFILVLIIIYLSLQSISRLQEDMAQVLHSQQVISGYDDLLSVMKDAETGQRGFLLTGDSSFLEPYFNAAPQLYIKTNDLRNLLSDRPDQLKRLKQLDSLILKRRAYLKTNLDQPVFSVALFKEGKREMDEIRKVTRSGKEEEYHLMEHRKMELERSRSQTRTTITIFSLVALALVILPLVFTLYELRKRLALQQLLDSVLNSSVNGIQSFGSIRDQNGKIVDFKFIQANEASYGIAHKQDGSFIGKTLLEVFPELRSQTIVNQFKEVVTNGTPLNTSFEFSSNGVKRWFHITAVKLRDGFTLTMHDTTQAMQAAIALENSVLALKRSNAELEQFAYVASHDLQEPLRKIMTFIDRMKVKSEWPLSEDSLNYLQRISNAAMRMRVLIDDLLSYSRMVNVPFETAPVDLNELMKEVLSDLEIMIAQKGARVLYNDLPTVNGMKIQLQQLFQNLLSNSLKFSLKDKPPVVTITSEYISDPSQTSDNTRQGKNFCRIKFTDNGIGFEEKYGDKIFQIFQRLHGRSEYEGTGIGLAICKKIVENHKGSITAQGTPGEGATFIILLPLK